MGRRDRDGMVVGYITQNVTLVQEDYTQVSIAKLMNIRLIFTFVLVLEIFNSVWVMVRCIRYKIMGQMKVREYRRGNQ
jgi:rRNA maturation endonuclease Nob1